MQVAEQTGDEDSIALATEEVEGMFSLAGTLTSLLSRTTSDLS